MVCNLYTGVLFDSLRAATDDKGFHLPSKEAQSTLASASSLLKWATMPSSTADFQLTASKLAEQLSHLVKKPPTTKASREKMWLHFAEYIRSSDYHLIWNTLSLNTAVQLSPILSYFLTHCYLLHLLRTQFQLAEPAVIEPPLELSTDEESALAYVGGYIIRSLREKIERSKPELMLEMVIGLYSFREDSEQCEESDGDGSEDETVDWVKMVNRGGLFHCRIEFKHFLYAIEYVVKQEMRLGKESAMKAGFKEKMSSIIRQDEDVLFWWSTLCAITDVDNTTAEALLPQIVALYVTIRGFAFAGRWMEAFKQSNKKSLQRSKSLRNKLQANEADS